MQKKLIVQDFYCLVQDSAESSVDRFQFFCRASDRFFSLNHGPVLKEIPGLPEGAKRIHERDKESEDTDLPTEEFYREVIAIKDEYGGDITMFLDNGYQVRCFLDLHTGEVQSYRVIEFFTADEIKKYDVPDDPDDMEDVSVEFLDDSPRTIINRFHGGSRNRRDLMDAEEKHAETKNQARVELADTLYRMSIPEVAQWGQVILAPRFEEMTHRNSWNPYGKRLIRRAKSVLNRLSSGNLEPLEETLKEIEWVQHWANGCIGFGITFHRACYILYAFFSQLMVAFDWAYLDNDFEAARRILRPLSRIPYYLAVNKVILESEQERITKDYTESARKIMDKGAEG